LSLLFYKEIEEEFEDTKGTITKAVIRQLAQWSQIAYEILYVNPAASEGKLAPTPLVAHVI